MVTFFFVWRSLYAAKQLVGNGFWWCVGDGASIQVFNDPWLNNEATFYVEKVPIEGLEELYVKMLMTEDGMGWDRSFDEGVLSPHDVAHVFNSRSHGHRIFCLCTLRGHGISSGLLLYRQRQRIFAGVALETSYRGVNMSVAYACRGASNAEQLGRQHRWEKPCMGKYKCNIDAAYSCQENATGFAATVRD
ncbi:hypothetical protein GOBAR_AA21183 [Gossypium barbadense]|uniref:RNase H type-1 domain-containing protein n=1 Tax=Gossypium barbadense TaxID=3634 RepID=A0A2P5X846_GOSBA|nr:hypothetical protein GOBAR_AA21183 [Gossypium barbadense]